ncbi:MAG TPA: CHAT domain-containing tetratricopeptide repeat protein [Pyrinomonadaceae bacterium]|nr:CHAT domain-containing tetratricopeptide repeat protein [Pyrinomonadaceae bacterium]
MPGFKCRLLALLVAFSLAQIARSQDGPKTLSAQIDDLAATLVATTSSQERDALLVTRKELVTPDLRKSLVRTGNAQMMSGEYARALEIYKIAENVAGRIGDKDGLAAAAMNIGTVYYFQGKYDLALDRYATARKLSLETQNSYEAAKALAGMALIYRSQQNDDAALDSYELALKEFTSLNNQEEMANALNEIGAIHYDRRNYSAATEALLRSNGLNPNADNTLRLADTFYMQGDYDKSSSYYADALREFSSRHQMAGMVGASVGAANSSYYRGKYEEALDFFRRNIELAEALRDDAGVATSLQGMGNAYRAQGDYASALDSYLQSLARARRSSYKIPTANLLGSIGLVRAIQGANVAALDYYNQSLTEFETTADKVGMARMLSYIGNAYYAQGNYDAALASFNRALSLREAMSDRVNQGNLLVGIGTVHFAQRNYPKALETYQQALTLFESASNQAAIADVLTRLSDVHLSQGDYEECLAQAERAGTLAKQVDNSETQWYARLLEGKAQRKLDRLPQAIQSFTEAIAIVESLRGRPASGEFASDRNGVLPYLALVDLFVNQNKPADAFAYAERAKVQALAELLRRGGALSARGLSPEERNQERKLVSEIVSLDLQLDRESQSRTSTAARRAALNERRLQTLAAYADFRKTLFSLHPGLKVDRGEPVPAKLEDVQKVQNDKQSAFIEYAITENKVYLFVVSFSEAKKVSVPNLKVYPLTIGLADLANKVTSFTKSLAQRDESFTEPARDLYELLLGPAAGQLTGRSKLIVVPDSVLWRLPFEALQPAADRFVIDQATISYAPSLSALREMMKPHPVLNRSRNWGLVAFADPAFSIEQQQRLAVSYPTAKVTPVSARSGELERLQSIYGEAQARVYLGVNATKERVQSETSQAGTLHFAVPTVLDDVNPMYSFITLSAADNSQGNGLLQTKEIVNLQTPARVVVHSAASLSNDRIGTGEAMIGLTWSWFVAGSPSTVVTRWEPDGSSVTELMAGFHRKLRARIPAAKASLLQQSALTLRRSPEYHHPYYWASFALLGNPR